MYEPLVKFGPAIDGKGLAAGCANRMHNIRAGRLHQMDFSKALREMSERRMNAANEKSRVLA